MKSITRSVSRDLFLAMTGFGLLTGLLFPFFTRAVLKLPAKEVLSPVFFLMCIIAGIIVAAFNFTIFRLVVCRFLKRMMQSIISFKDKLEQHQNHKEERFQLEGLRLEVESQDTIGDIAAKFNNFSDTIVSYIGFQQTMDRFLSQLKTSNKIDQVAETVLTTFLEYFGGEGGFLLGIEPGALTLLHQIKTKIDPNSLDTEYWHGFLSEGKSVLVNAAKAENLKLDIGIGELTPAYVAYIPLKYQEINVGICVLLSSQPFQKEFHTLESRNFINEAIPFVYNGILMHRMELLAAIDELTDVLNRRFGIKRLSEEFARSQRHNLPLSLVMIDIDNFKSINDTYSHQCGDFVLKTLAQVLKQDIRASDFVIRYGGEEFLIIFPGASGVDVNKIMQRILKQSATLKIQWGSYELNITFSGGIASFPSGKISVLNDMIQIADKALYKAKAEGKNRIVLGA